MKKFKVILYLLFLGFLQIAAAQEVPNTFKNSFTEHTSEEQKFEIYVDSIDEYLYRNFEITEFAIAKCQEILDQKIPLPDSTLFDFVLLKIFFKHNLADPLGAYQIISKHENKLNSLEISDVKKGTFNYLKSFTYMAIGDLEAAQKTYYQNLERAKIQKDTSAMIGTLYSLGQLYKDEQDPAAAIQSFEKTLAYARLVTMRPSTMTLIYMELSESLQALKKHDKAIAALDTAFHISSENKLEMLELEILIQKGTYYLSTGEAEKARKIYTQIQNTNKSIQDENIRLSTALFLANLYRTEKNHQLSLDTYLKIRAQIDTNNYDQTMLVNNRLQEISYETGDFQSAHAYLLDYNSVKKKRDEDVKKQKTDYLKIKFESEAKEKENAMLATEIVQTKSRTKILFLSLAIFSLILLLSIGAYYQKMKYSKNLELEVSKRTNNLKEVNKELREFNRILSHDLKEPIRSIVGFSQLANRSNDDPKKLEEYLDFVINSGQQLSDLIANINAYQQIDDLNFFDFNLVNLPEIINEIVDSISANYPDKKIEVFVNTSSAIHAVYNPLLSILEMIFQNAFLYNENELVKIQVDYTLKDQMHFIEIKDNGIGIEAAYHEKIFDKFTRLNNRATYRGSGMGLSIAKKMIERMNGSIAVLPSQDQQGSTFLLRLPVLSLSKEDLSRIETENFSSTSM